MKKKTKIILISVGSVIAVLALITAVLAIGAWSMFGTMITAANSIEKLEDGLYSMEFFGDYGFDAFIEQGGASSDKAVADYLTVFLSHGFYKPEVSVETEGFGCSTVCTKDENGSVWFGRNYDWEECRTMIVHTKPDKGYESFSTCCLDFLGFGEDYTPDGSMPDRILSLAAVYVPLDGMNEKGLIVADLMAGDKEETHQNTDKPDLTTTTAIRLLLDRAASVDEAVAMLKDYDMNSSIGSAHHFSIADASGKSVVVEYVNGEMLVKETKVVTNHYLTECEKKGIGSEQSHLRYDKLDAHEGLAGGEEVRELLESVAQKNYPQSEEIYEKTMWSIVYCPDGLCADFYFSENYEHGYRLILSDKEGFLKH